MKYTTAMNCTNKRKDNAETCCCDVVVVAVVVSVGEKRERSACFIIMTNAARIVEENQPKYLVLGLPRPRTI